MKPLEKIPQWSPTLAYTIGLITTDGNLSSDGRHINFTSKDKQLVQTFKECLRLQNKIGHKARERKGIKRYYQIQFGNIVLYRWLLDIGLTPNKSKTINTLEIPNQYFADFLRGHLDGDGSIKVYQDPVWKKSQRIYVVFNSASILHIEWLQHRIKSLFGVKGFLRTANTMFSLTFAKKESLRLLPNLYHRANLPCLERKRTIVQSVL